MCVCVCMSVCVCAQVPMYACACVCVYVIYVCLLSVPVGSVMKAGFCSSSKLDHLLDDDFGVELLKTCINGIWFIHQPFLQIN